MTPLITLEAAPDEGPSRRWPTPLLALLGQLLLLGTTYAKLLFHPGQYLIIDHYDGIKSYFSVASFLRQPLGDGMLVRGHNYPFGEYMYYTDSTPLLVAPLHWLVQLVPALSPYGLYLYDLVILSSLPLSTWLLALILRRLAVPAGLTVLLAVALPWLGPQTVRLNVGHMSLAYTPAVLFLIWRLQHLYEAWRAGHPLAGQFGWLTLGIVATSWLHFYYLPLLGGPLVFFVAGLLYESWRAGRPWRGLVLGTGATLLASLTLTWGLLRAFDSRYAERPVGSSGYDWVEWRFQFTALFQGYVYNKVRFPLERLGQVPYESSAYLTSFVLFGLLLTAGLILLRRLPAAARLPRAADDDNYLFLKYLLLASLPLAFVALGENIELDNGNYVVHNYLNGFRWLRHLTERITQFRALGRFIWPFWWALVLSFGWYAARWQRLPGLRWALGALGVLLAVDTLNATHHYRTATQRPNLLAAPVLAVGPVQQLVGWAKPGRYQAILPLPYFHVGTEKESGAELNVDPDDPHCNTTYQLSMLTGLPLMSHKATRAIHLQAEQLYSIFQPGGPHPALLARLDQRPILVFLDSAYYDGRNNYYRDLLRERPDMRAIFERGPTFIQERHLRRISHQGSWSLYEWFPKGGGPQ